jgi:hypothetical protein
MPESARESSESSSTVVSPLPSRPKERRNPIARWLFRGRRLDVIEEHGSTQPWYVVLWLTGVDYFSTLGYQPGIALLAAGALSPVATALLVAVTLFCALPMYAQVAGRSFVGLGSIAMLENLFQGWGGKLLVLSLLGFAATGFVFTITLSAADAALHAIENPYLGPIIGASRLLVTIVLLAGLAALFLRGFNEAIGLATFVAVPYLLLNATVLLICLTVIAADPMLLANWRSALSAKGDWTTIFLASALVFPRLALGLSGFETGVSVMPLIRGEASDEHSPVPRGRVQNTRKLLAAAALIMSVMLMVSSFATALLIPAREYQEGGAASGRAIAYLAHKYLGSGFGSVYDFSTILILWFAGASAMVGLLHLIPRYLPRFGMAPMWVAFPRPLILALCAISVVVTVFFDARVEVQAGPYATGVLGLMFSGAFAAALSLWRDGRTAWSAWCWVIAAIFLYALTGNVIERPDGILIAATFIFLTVGIGMLSRYTRATELRVSSVDFSDFPTKRMWGEICGKKVNLVPIRTASDAARRRKAVEIRKHYKVRGPLAFVHVFLIDNRSEFLTPIQVKVFRDGEDYIINVTGAIAIANTIAYVSEQIDPIALFLGLTRQKLMTQSLRFFLFGEGETGLLVYTILLRYWEHTVEEDVRPFIYLMSD